MELNDFLEEETSIYSFLCRKTEGGYVLSMAFVMPLSDLDTVRWYFFVFGSGRGRLVLGWAQCVQCSGFAFCHDLKKILQKFDLMA
mmetsp:Transcript_51525/g.77083  ORF Transcript_51525/g.77083 Transcript_51525/m.77083 type:complete len:86 (+) Transcript_51525:396-653(+)